MEGKDYQDLAMRTNDGEDTYRLCHDVFSENTDLGGLLNGCLGLAGESGELLDIVKKWVFHEKPLDQEHLKKELGDVLWYVALISYSMAWDLDEVMELNVNKLKARYPEGFDVIRANHRKEGDI